MSKKRTISIRHPQLVRFRNALREVITAAEIDEIRRLREKKKGLKPVESDTDMQKIKALNDRQSKLNTAWKKSICTCSLCGSRASDMTYNTHFKEWFCVECYKKSQEFYKEKANEGEIWNDNSVNRVPSTKWWS